MHRRQVLGVLSGAVLAAPLAGSTLFAGPAAASPEKQADPRGTQLRTLLEAEHDAGMPGAIAQVRDGEKTFRLAVGAADIASGRPPHPFFRHRIGGITKTFVSTTLLQLAGERRVQLDAPIGQYLPDIVPGERGQQITVRMLLNQTTGISDHVNVLFATPESIAETATHTYRPEELVRMALALPPLFAPGAMWSYSNSNYVVLGLLIEKITGRPWAAEVHRRIIGPLGLHDTYAPGTRTGIQGPHMSAYIPWTDGTLRNFTTYNMTWAGAAGELISSTRDVNRFFRALLGGHLLRPSLLQEMKTTVPFSADFPDFAGYGLGLFWLLTPSGKTWGHNGQVIGMTTYSAHTEDGSTTQLTLAENMNFYKNPADQTPNAIDNARNAFMAAVESGPTSAQQRLAGTAPARLFPPTFRAMGRH